MTVFEPENKMAAINRKKVWKSKSVYTQENNKVPMTRIFVAEEHNGTDVNTVMSAWVVNPR